MKKSALKKFFRFVLNNSVKGLVIFLAFGTAAYVYAITYPATQPNDVSGVVGLFVNATPTAYNGNTVGGYENANEICAKTFEYSHVCTAMEMTNTYNHAPALLNGLTESYWINQGSPGNLTDVNNDCRGWKSGLSTDFGSVWNTQKDASYITSCDLSRKIACCK